MMTLSTEASRQFRLLFTAFLSSTLVACSSGDNAISADNPNVSSPGAELVNSNLSPPSDAGLIDANIDNSSLNINAEELDNLTVTAAPAVQNESTSTEATDSLVHDISTFCPAVGESFSVKVARKLASDMTQTSDVTRFITITQSNGTSLELISRTDEQISLKMNKQDIVVLTSDVNGASVSAYLAAYDAESSTRLLMRKPVPGGCMYAMRLENYCATGQSKSGVLRLSFEEEGITALGCSVENPDNLPIVDLTP